MTGKIPTPNEFLYEICTCKGIEPNSSFLFSRFCQEFWMDSKKVIAFGERPGDKNEAKGWRYDLEVTVAMPEKDFQPILMSFAAVARVFGWDYAAIDYEFFSKGLIRINTLWIGNNKMKQ